MGICDKNNVYIWYYNVTSAELPLYYYRPIANHEKARSALFVLSVVTVQVLASKSKIAATNAEPEVPVLSTA